MAYALLFAVLATARGAEGQAHDIPRAAQSIGELKQQLERILADTHTPGLSVAIVRRDGPEWVAGLGKADVAAGVAASPETLFRIGSTSKPFASLAILKLVNEGQLSLQDPVHQLAPDVWFENAWEAHSPVRVVDLLEHTTGWDGTHLREFAQDAAGMGLREALDYTRASRVSRWPPGTRMAYCNAGPAVAAYIVEKITGQRFEDYVTQNFFLPIGMKTATYFQPVAGRLTVLYHSDGVTPISYWNIIFRPSGAINASANDMAAYLMFYLNRGTVDGAQVMPATSIDRMEIPTRTWAAQAGMQAGYGLGNYWSIEDGFVYHGHEGQIPGALTDLAYLPEYGVGYFFSLNSSGSGAYDKIDKAIRAYITSNFPKPALPAAGRLPAGADSYRGWYEPDSPSFELARFLERLMGLARFDFQEGRLQMTSLAGKRVFVPVIGAQFREAPEKGIPDPVPTVELLSPDAQEKYIQIDATQTMKRIPAWLALTEIILLAWVVLALVSVLVYAPFWLFGGLRKQRRRPADRGMRVWPLIAVLSLAAVAAIFVSAGEDIIQRLGNPTGWSAAIFLCTVLYAVASVISVVAVFRASKDARPTVRRYSIAVVAGLLIAALYLAYWGVIGLRTWA
jgi:CubicO group peptidase (beta-lactamase class C family)